MQLRPGKPEEAGVSPEGMKQIAALAQGWVDQGITPALAVLAARKGVVFLHEAFGRLRPAPDAPPVAPDAIYPLASLSKPITATALMCLVEDGLVSLSRPVLEYIPEFSSEFVNEGRERIKVRHLLTHTSGLRDKNADALAERLKGAIKLPLPEPTQHPVIHEHLHLRYGVPLWKSPGKEMCYFNFGYMLLGEIVRRASGKSFEGFCRERIFEPLGMKDTFFTVPDAVKHRIVKRHDGTPFDWWDSPANEAQPDPAGGGFSTAPDMAAFGQMFLNGGGYGDARILSPVTIAAMTRDQTQGVSRLLMDEELPDCPYGLGWFIFGEDASRRADALWSPGTFGHFGTGGAMLWIDPLYEIVGAFFFAQLVEKVWLGDLFANAVTAAIVSA